MKRKLAIILASLLFVGAVGIMVYPVIANYINEKHQSLIQTEYTQKVKEMDDSTILKAREAAQAYNEGLNPMTGAYLAF